MMTASFSFLSSYVTECLIPFGLAPRLTGCRRMSRDENGGLYLVLFLFAARSMYRLLTIKFFRNYSLSKLTTARI
jgi:hypothetical protein